MLNKLSLILLATIHEVFTCISVRAKRSNPIVPHAAITDKKKLFALVPALCAETHTKRALTVTDPVTRDMAVQSHLERAGRNIYSVQLQHAG